MLFYFKLQYQRIYRIINDFGMPPIFGIPLIIFVFITLSNLVFSKINDAPILYVAVALFYIFSFGSTERTIFLKTVFSKYHFQKVRLIENLIIALPFSFFLLYKTAFGYAFLVLFLSGILSFFSTTQKVSFVIPTPFYKHPFEFIIGFRRFFVIIFCAYALTIIAINVLNFNLGIFALCVMGILIPEFYTKPEPKTFVWTHNLSPTVFLKQKIITALKYSLWLSAPVHLVLWIVFPTKFYITIAFQGVAFCYLIAYILGKYKHFPKVMLITTGFTIGICLLFPPLFLIVIPYFYKEASTNLARFL